MKEALTTFLDQIKSDDERVGLIEFYNDVTERVKISELKNNRSDLVRAVTNSGSRRQYRAARWGRGRLRSLAAAQRSQPHQRDCGDDRRQGERLDHQSESTGATLQHGNERGVPVVVFGIAYGSDADMNALESIADATGGQTYGRHGRDDCKLYKILSTYF